MGGVIGRPARRAGSAFLGIFANSPATAGAM